MMSDLEKTMEEEREALRREAAAMAASAAAAGEDKARTPCLPGTASILDLHALF